jgi:hypothetical protein
MGCWIWTGKSPKKRMFSGMHHHKEKANVMQNQTPLNAAGFQIADGMTAYGADGDKVGTVRNYDPQAGYLDIQKGWLFTKDFYVGLAAVQAVNEDGIVLRLTKQELSDDRYASPPTGGVIYGEGFIITEKEPVEAEREDVTVMSTAEGGPL